MRFLIILQILCLLTAGCNRSKNYDKTVRDGIQTIPHVQEIKKVFPGIPTDNFFEMYGIGDGNPLRWDTELFLAGRYIFTYQVDVIVDYDKGIKGSVLIFPHQRNICFFVSRHPLSHDAI